MSQHLLAGWTAELIELLLLLLRALRSHLKYGFLPVQEHFSATCARLYRCAESTKTPTGSSQLKQLPATVSYSEK